MQFHRDRDWLAPLMYHNENSIVNGGQDASRGAKTRPLEAASLMWSFSVC